MEDTQRRAERRRRELRRKRARQRLIIVGSLALIAGLALGAAGGSLGKEPLKKEVTDLNEKLKEKDKELEAVQLTLSEQQEETSEEVELPWNLTLVNKWNEMEEGYVPDLVEVEEGQEVDARIADATKEMLADAKEAGVSPFICSAYRSVDRQEELFNNGVKKRINKGLGYYDAYIETATVVAVPGTSEHALGLAVDIVAVSNQNLDESQEETAEAKWLMENCHKYGFILRYPNGTTDITGIIYEPWHYRYVGVEAATEITELGITLEEYLEEHYEP